MAKEIFHSRVYTERPAYADFSAPAKFTAIQSIIAKRLKEHTDVGDLVLDNCAGSCSTGIACHNTGRRFIGFEKDGEIFERASKRLNEHKAQLNLFDLGMERK